MEQLIEIRKADFPKDGAGIWAVLEPVIRKGDSFAYNPDASQQEIMAYWCQPAKYVYVAVIADEIVGSFFIQANQPGLGSHVANAGYAVSPARAGQGIGRAMGAFSLIEAKALGYKAMQFNIVVKSNKPAVNLWKSLGFESIGEIPDAFDHKVSGLTNAYIMYRKL